MIKKLYRTWMYSYSHYPPPQTTLKWEITDILKKYIKKSWKSFWAIISLSSYTNSMDSQVANCFVTGSNFPFFTPWFSKRNKKKDFHIFSRMQCNQIKTQSKGSLSSGTNCEWFILMWNILKQKCQNRFPTCRSQSLESIPNKM